MLVDENLEDGKQKLQRIELSTQTKTQAKADIAQAIGQQRSTIDQNQNATTEENKKHLRDLIKTQMESMIEYKQL